MFKPALTVKVALVIAGLSLLTACSHFNMGTMWAMRNVDFKTVDPTVVRLALGLPDGADFESVDLELKLSKGDELLMAETIAIEVITTGPEVNRVGFPLEVHNGVVLKIPDDQVAVIAEMRRRMANLERQEIDGSLDIGIKSRFVPAWIAKVCTGDTPRRLKVKSWIMIDEAQGYLPLLKDSTLGKLIGSTSAKFCQQEG
ncbi:MAG: hypothetical protein COB54_00910 [Alphaproteobacteria bacterium]|nr:MAG: hypothetical protein COB54_00910 [Alphaproteobacteria bacterium]